MERTCWWGDRKNHKACQMLGDHEALKDRKEARLDVCGGVTLSMVVRKDLTVHDEGTSHMHMDCRAFQAKGTNYMCKT